MMPECIDADECCCICLGTLAKERCTRQACGHHFHIKCLRENLRFSLECPLCRALWHDIAVVRMRSAPAAKQSIEDFALLLDRVCPAKKKTRTQYILHRDGDFYAAFCLVKHGPGVKNILKRVQHLAAAQRAGMIRRSWFVWLVQCRETQVKILSALRKFKVGTLKRLIRSVGKDTHIHFRRFTPQPPGAG